MEGFVTSIDTAGGYGFLGANGKKYFFHHDDLPAGIVFSEQLLEMVLAFDVLQEPRGPRAVRVRSLSACSSNTGTGATTTIKEPT